MERKNSQPVPVEKCEMGENPDGKAADKNRPVQTSITQLLASSWRLLAAISILPHHAVYKSTLSGVVRNFSGKICRDGHAKNICSDLSSISR